MPKQVDQKTAIEALVESNVASFAAGFQARHLAEFDNPNGTLNMKIHNVFIAALGPETQYYTSLVRSFDSSLGSMLEDLAISNAKLNFEVHQRVEGPLSDEQIIFIGNLLEKYKSRAKSPAVSDYQPLRKKPAAMPENRRHDSDYYLIDKANGDHYLIELKIGGDLDNKKARSEKEAILEQFAILSNSLPENQKVNVFFATAYNRFGENQPWAQERVRQFFADEELLIGRDFWNFICQSSDGYKIVIDSYKKSAQAIREALDSIRIKYLGEQRV